MVMKPPSLKQTEEEIQLIVNWLSFRNKGGKTVNWLLYHKGNKADACRQLLEETKLIEKSGVSKQKTRDKIPNGEIRQILLEGDQTFLIIIRWGNNTNGKTIREVLLLKCSFYYEFEEIIGDSPTINPPFLIESGLPNHEAEVRESFFIKILYFEKQCCINLV